MDRKKITTVVSTAVLAALAIAFAVLLLMLVGPLSYHTSFAWSVSRRTVYLLAFLLVTGLVGVVFILNRVLNTRRQKKT